MRHVRPGVISGLVFCAVATIVRAEPATRPTTDEAIASEIERLGDRRPDQREAARRALLARGRAARVRVSAATRSLHPAIAAAARQLLLDLPWDVPGDPAELRQSLIHYGRLSEDERCALVDQAISLGTRDAYRVAGRMLDEDPGGAVAWRASEMLGQRVLAGDDRAIEMARFADTARPAGAALVALAVRDSDRGRALGLVAQLLEQEVEDPAATGPQLEWSFGLLSDDAEKRADWPAVARVRRQQILLTPGDGYARAALFALHAWHGPLDGFQDDLRAYLAGPAEPRVLYALSILWDRFGAYVPARLAREQAVNLTTNAGDSSHYNHYLAGDFLLANGWPRLAETELLVALEVAHGGRGDYVINCYFRLSEIYLRRGENDKGADFLEQGLARVNGGMRRKNPDGNWEEWRLEDAKAQVQWHHLVAARERKDAAAITQRAVAIAELQPKETWMLLDVQADLVAAGKPELLRTYFTAVRQHFLDQLAKAPDDPKLLNDLAWLCARSGLSPDEGLTLARRATTIKPDNAAFQDTLGEAAFRTGNSAEAVAAEKKALALKPGDTFMAEQLAKFEKAAAAEK